VNGVYKVAFPCMHTTLFYTLGRKVDFMQHALQLLHTSKHQLFSRVLSHLVLLLCCAKHASGRFGYEELIHVKPRDSFYQKVNEEEVPKY